MTTKNFVSSTFHCFRLPPIQSELPEINLLIIVSLVFYIYATISVDNINNTEVLILFVQFLLGMIKGNLNTHHAGRFIYISVHLYAFCVHAN